MTRKAQKTRNRNRIVSGALVLVMMLMLGIPGINVSMANPIDAEIGSTILYFDPEDTVFEKWVEPGTAREEIGLPDELRAMIEIVSEIRPDDETESPTATGTSLVDSDAVYETEIIAANIPVTWEGYYDGGEPGVYTLSAHVEGYMYDGVIPVAIITVDSVGSIVPETGSISGFFWVDGNGNLETDWDGLYDDDEYPLQDYPVSLYYAWDLSSPIASTRTNEYGKYVFEGLEPDSYVLRVIGETVGEFEFLPPIFLTSDNKFKINWSIPGLPAYTEVIELALGQSISEINAGMRLPMGMAAYKATSLANLGSADVNDTLNIDGYTWVVVKKTTVGSGSNAINAVYLIMRGNIFSSLKFGNSPDYDSSDLRARMKRIMDEKRLPTIQAMALIPNLGAHNSPTALTIPTAVMAGNQTQDILFAPSLKDMVDWTGVEYGKQIPSAHPLSKSASLPFSQRFWFRTSRNAGEVYGYIHANNSLEGGLSHNGTNIVDVPAVWVNAGSINSQVTVHYVDTAGKSIGVPTFKKYDVTFGSAFSLPSNEIPKIGNFKYIEWRKSLFGAAQNFSQNPNLTKTEVSNGTNLYLVYEDDSAHKVTVHYIDEAGNSIGLPPDTYQVHAGNNFILDTIPTIYGYRYTGDWKQGSLISPIRDDEVKLMNVTADIDVFLIFEKLNAQVADGEKNAYVRGSTTAENGSASSPVPVEGGDSIRYTITANNDKLTGNLNASYDVMFVLDWSDSMASTMVPGQSARLYERDVMLDMSDFILDNYPNSRISVMAMNSTGMTDNPVNTYIQLQTDFLDKTQFAAARNSIVSAFDVAPKNHTEDLVSFLKAANQRMDSNQAFTYGNKAGGAVNTIPRSDKTRTPVIIMISDFQIPLTQSVGSQNYWSSLMNVQSARFKDNSPGGILLTVRLDHAANTTGPNSVYSDATHDLRMREYVSPRGQPNWGFTKVSYGTSYTEALRKVKSDFLELAPPGAHLGTIITDKVPEGLVVDANSISHHGAYDPVTRIITWDLSEENYGEITVEFTVTVDKVPGIFRNTADVIHYDGVEGSTNTTYHESKLRTSVDVTISKTVTGSHANRKTVFEFTLYLIDEDGPGINANKEFAYTGGVIAGTVATAPDDDVLVLSDDGYDNAVFHLSHGQTITIHNVPVDSYIMVVETLEDKYTTKVRDSSDNSVHDGHYTSMQHVGNENRRFDFINNKDGAVPTGIDSGTWSLVLFSLSAVALIASGMAGIALIKRRQATGRR